MRSRLIIKKLILKGVGKQDAIICFQKGLNVIAGASDTGKSFAFECINYVLGSSEMPSCPPEAKGYQSVFLEIEDSCQQEIFTLRRDFSQDEQNSIYLCYSEYKDIGENNFEKLSSSHKAKKSLSKRLLNVCDCTYETVISKAAKGTTQSFTFRSFIPMIMMGELRVTEKHSPIYRTNPRGSIYSTSELTAFQTVISGNDYEKKDKEDSVEIVKAKLRGQIEELSHMIEELRIENADLEVKTKDVNYPSLMEEIEKINKFIECKNEEVKKYEMEYEQLQMKSDEIKRKVTRLNDNISKEIARNTRICSGKYFDLYFSYGNNEYLKIGKEISDMVDEITKTESEDLLYEYLCDKIARIPAGIQREWFERLQSYLDLIPAEKKLIFTKSIFDCLNNISSSFVFMGLNAQSRALVCIELLLEETEINAMQKFANEIRAKYDKLYMIDQILYWFQNTRSQHTEDVKIRETILKEKFSEMCEKIIEEEINIYADSYYIQYNIWGLIHYLKIKENRGEIVHTYIAKIINNENIFRVMGDMISQSIGNAYGYRISEENFEIFFKDTSLLDLLLQKVAPKTQSEKFVLKVYDKFKSDETDSRSNKEITSEVEVLLKL